MRISFAVAVKTLILCRSGSSQAAAEAATTAEVMAEATEAAAVSAMAAVAIEDKITSSIPGTRDPAYRVQTDTHTPVFSFYGGRSDGGKQ